MTTATKKDTKNKYETAEMAEKASYCIGLATGRDLKMRFSDINLEVLQEGIIDALKAKTASDLDKIEPKTFEDVMTRVQYQVNKQQEEMYAQLSEKNKIDGEAFMKNAATNGFEKKESGLLVKKLRSAGGGVSPKIIDTVEVHYEAKDIYGNLLDSSRQRGKPAEMPLNGVLAAWQEALQNMSEGDKVELVAPHWLAYGQNGLPQGNIGPNQTLHFELELISVKKK